MPAFHVMRKNCTNYRAECHSVLNETNVANLLHVILIGIWSVRREEHEKSEEKKIELAKQAFIGINGICKLISQSSCARSLTTFFS